MLRLRRATERGHGDHGWLDTHHAFSFADYYDPAHMGFRALRVLNEDRVQPGRGFGTHGHSDMEIISYVLAGALEHHDSMGNGSVIRPGDVQRMTAGTGVRHSEKNHSTEEPVHFLQIWIVPDRSGLVPDYEQSHFELDERRGKLVCVASKDGKGGSVTIHQDVTMLAGRFAGGQRTAYELASGRGAWVHVARGRAKVGALELGAGDAVAVEDERVIAIEALADAEVLVLDLA